MPVFHVVTDSCAHFGAQPVPDHVTVVPNTLIIGGRSYREGVDLSHAEAIALMRSTGEPARVVAPSTAELARVYERLAPDCDGILSLHASQELFETCSHARTAAMPYTGRCRVAAIDSGTLSVAQGMLVALAAREAMLAETFDDLVRTARGAIDHTYSVFTVDTLDYALHNRILAPSQSILGAMLNIRPLLSVEDGQIIAIEKVRTRPQAIERLVEYVVEFTEVIDAAIVQPFAGEREWTSQLEERLTLDFPDFSFRHTPYGASLAALIGLDAIGLAVIESPLNRIDDDP